MVRSVDGDRNPPLSDDDRIPVKFRHASCILPSHFSHKPLDFECKVTRGHGARVAVSLPWPVFVARKTRVLTTRIGRFLTAANT